MRGGISRGNYTIFSMASPSKQEDLWAALYPDDNDEEQDNDIPIFTGAELGDKSLNEIIDYDMNNEKVLYRDTVVLKTSLGFCEHIFKTVYKVADYVPDLNNDENSEFWKESVSMITWTKQNLSEIIYYIKSSYKKYYLSFAGHS